MSRSFCRMQHKNWNDKCGRLDLLADWIIARTKKMLERSEFPESKEVGKRHQRGSPSNANGQILSPPHMPVQK